MPLYFILALIWSFIWIIIFFLHRGKRGKILVMSSAVIVFSFFDYYSRPGYWHPPTFFSLPVGIEDILFGFSFGGIASVLFPLKINRQRVPIKPVVNLRNIVALSPVLIVSILLNVFFKVNIMITLPIGLLTGCLVISIIRPDLSRRLLYSGLYFGLFYLFILLLWFWIFPQSQRWWNLEVYGGITVFNVPLGEVLFGFLFGAFWGVLYEFIFGLDCPVDRLNITVN